MKLSWYFRRVGGLGKNPFCGVGMDIFWNYTILRRSSLPVWCEQPDWLPTTSNTVFTQISATALIQVNMVGNHLKMLRNVEGMWNRRLYQAKMKLDTIPLKDLTCCF